ncbi:hypothetical protein [Alteriqipengyuania sp. 357]
MSDMTFAPLSPTLLARKGSATPAMRRQSLTVPGAQACRPEADTALEDLGWNDLGEPQEPARAGQPGHTAAQHSREDDSATLAHHAKSTANLARPKGKRAAFTLRLDPERHLKLRLACTLAGRSAQSLATEALDAMLADMPDLETLYARVQSRTHQEG